jgi:hypothetical protein
VLEHRWVARARIRACRDDSAGKLWLMSRHGSVCEGEEEREEVTMVLLAVAVAVAARAPRVREDALVELSIMGIGSTAANYK